MTVSIQMKKIAIAGFLFTFNVNMKVLYLPMSPKCKAFNTLITAGQKMQERKRTNLYIFIMHKNLCFLLVVELFSHELKQT